MSPPSKGTAPSGIAKRMTPLFAKLHCTRVLSTSGSFVRVGATSSGPSALSLSSAVDGLFVVTVVRGEGIRDREVFASQSPFVSAQLTDAAGRVYGKARCGTVVKGGSDPVWPETDDRVILLEFHGVPSSSSLYLIVEVWDDSGTRAKVIARSSLPLSAEVVMASSHASLVLPLSGATDSKDCGALHVEFQQSEEPLRHLLCVAVQAWYRRHVQCRRYRLMQRSVPRIQVTCCCMCSAALFCAVLRCIVIADGCSRGRCVP
jgi:hypothetical protein